LTRISRAHHALWRHYNFTNLMHHETYYTLYRIFIWLRTRLCIKFWATFYWYFRRKMVWSSLTCMVETWHLYSCPAI
jgi:hypothetical protein